MDDKELDTLIKKLPQNVEHMSEQEINKMLSNSFNPHEGFYRCVGRALKSAAKHPSDHSR